MSLTKEDIFEIFNILDKGHTGIIKYNDLIKILINNRFYTCFNGVSGVISRNYYTYNFIYICHDFNLFITPI